MSIGDVATIIGSLFTGLSVIFALITYRRNEEKNAFKRFRLSFIDARHAIRQLDRFLSEPLFTEIGTNISLELRGLFPEHFTKEEFISYLSDTNNHDYIAQVIYLGRQKSSTIAQTRDLIAQLEKMPFEYKEQLPLVSALFTRLFVYVAQTVDGVISPKIYNTMLGTSDVVKEAVVPNLEDAKDENSIIRKVALILAVASKTLLEGQGQKVLNETSTLIEMVVNKFSSMSDAELNKQSAVQRSQVSVISSIDKQTAIEDAFEYFKLMKPLFSSTEWDTIVESKTRVYQEAHAKGKQDKK